MLFACKCGYFLVLVCIFCIFPILYVQLFSPPADMLCLPYPTELQGPSSQWVDVMKKKRAVHEKIINLVHQQRSSKSMEKVNLSCAS